MATVQKISTSEILELLRTNSDHTKFFYLYVSTSGREDKREKSKPLPAGQQTLDKYTQKEVEVEEVEEEVEEDSDDSESSGDGDVEAMDSSSQLLPVQGNPVAQNSPVLPSTPIKKPRKDAMNDVHQKILPQLLCPYGWKKVYDTDLKITYRALYFNTIEKQPNEDDITHIQRVGEYRKMISDKVEELKKERGVNFRINSLLSRPLLYDPPTLQEQSMREGSTQRKQQTQINAYFSKKT